MGLATMRQCAYLPSWKRNVITRECGKRTLTPYLVKNSGSMVQMSCFYTHMKPLRKPLTMASRGLYWGFLSNSSLISPFPTNTAATRSATPRSKVKSGGQLVRNNWKFWIWNSPLSKLAGECSIFLVVLFRDLCLAGDLAVPPQDHLAYPFPQ